MPGERAVVSVHVADVGLKGPLTRAPKPVKVSGLVEANAGLCAPLGPGLIPRVDPRRVAMVAFWESHGALEQFLAGHPVAERLSSGWHAALEPIRAFGSWPGLPDDIPRNRKVESDGPVVVTTLGKLKMSQAYRFLATSAKAEARVAAAPGLRWATGFGQPPFVATLSVWDSAQSAMDYAYGGSDAPEHQGAIDEDRSRPFHHRNAFVRYRPLAVSGSIDGSSLIEQAELA